MDGLNQSLGCLTLIGTLLTATIWPGGDGAGLASESAKFADSRNADLKRLGDFFMRHHAIFSSDDSFSEIHRISLHPQGPLSNTPEQKGVIVSNSELL